MPDPPDLPPVPPVTHDEIHAQIESRLAALEVNITRVEEKQPDSVELGRLRWFMKHGRRRPW